MNDFLAAGLADWSGVALALALGLLVGLQRGWVQRRQASGARFAGIRTFGLLGLAGGVAGAVFGQAEAIATIILATGAGLVLISYYRATQSGGSLSGTTSLVGLITMICGFLAAAGDHMAATAIAVTMVLLLSMRTQLHRLVQRMSETEMVAVARFALIAAVILPLLPDVRYGPYGAWNPRQLWLVVVLVSGFSLAGYVATRLLGPSRGTIATAAAGSVVSSTAVTAALAASMRDGQGSPAVNHAGVSAASAVMFMRVTALTGLLAPFALEWIARLAVPGILVGVAAAAWFLWRARGNPPGAAAAGGDAGLRLSNPFAIGPALLLMVLVMAMTLAAHWVLDRFGDSGLVLVLAISGTVDVDSAIITMGSLPRGTLAANMAGLVLLAPIVLNSLFKAGAAISIAGWRRAWPSALVLASSAVAACAAVPLVI